MVATVDATVDAVVVGPVDETVVIGPLGEESEQGAVEFMYWYWIYSANYWGIYVC